MSDREMLRQTSVKQTNPTQKLGNRTNRWSNVQAGARYPSSKKQFKQQRQKRQRQHRSTNDLRFNILSEIPLTEYVRQRQNSSYSPRMQDVWLVTLLFHDLL